MKLPSKGYSLQEEQLSGTIHLFGALLSIVGWIALLIRLSQKGASFSAYIGGTLFCLAACTLYLMSGIYHLLPKGKRKDLFKILDHSAIFLLISGTYTPFLLLIGGTGAWVMLGVQWALTVVGILFKTRFAGRSPLVSVLIYLAMGWMIVFIYAPARRELSQEALQFLLAGGLSYSIGTIAYLMKKVPYTHAIWHLFVMGGTIFHYSAVYLSL